MAVDRRVGHRLALPFQRWMGCHERLVLTECLVGDHAALYCGDRQGSPEPIAEALEDAEEEVADAS